MKTPEEIKKALKLCGRGCYSGCPYNSFECVEELTCDALEYIRQLEDQLREAAKKIARLETVNLRLSDAYNAMASDLDRVSSDRDRLRDKYHLM